MNGAFSAGPDPSPALLTDGQQMAFCVQRESRGGGQRGGEKRRGETQRWGGRGLEVFQASSVQGPI